MISRVVNVVVVGENTIFVKAEYDISVAFVVTVVVIVETPRIISYSLSSCNGGAHSLGNSTCS
jgi:type IV secretory pathway VirB2 component (pilin)